MTRTHVVRDGEHLAQIANAYGLSRDAIWLDPANETLRSHRMTSDLLNPGDQLVIPERLTVLPAAETGRRHVVELHEDTISIKLRLQDAFDEALADIAFDLLGPDGLLATGRTDTDGNVTATLPASVAHARLVLGEIGTELELEIGALNPISCRSGVQQRLANLGYYQGAIDSDFGPRTHAALLSFQASAGLTTTGVADDATREALERCNGRTPVGLEAEEDMTCHWPTLADPLADEDSDVEGPQDETTDGDWAANLDDEADEDGFDPDGSDEDDYEGEDDDEQGVWDGGESILDDGS